MTGPDRVEVLAAYDAGVDAVLDIAAPMGPSDWATPATDEWDATDLAGHLLAVARWYHVWLDRSEAGGTARPFPAEEMPARNAAELAALEIDGGPARLVEFETVARSYAERLLEAWDHTYVFPYGTVTAGTHAAAAASEWHIHAWDLGRVVGHDHRPADPALLYEGTGTAIAAGRAGLLPPRTKVVVARAMVRRAVRRADDPWRALLERSGRSPAG